MEVRLHKQRSAVLSTTVRVHGVTAVCSPAEPRSPWMLRCCEAVHFRSSASCGEKDPRNSDQAGALLTPCSAAPPVQWSLGQRPDSAHMCAGPDHSLRLSGQGDGLADLAQQGCTPKACHSQTGTSTCTTQQSSAASLTFPQLAQVLFSS